MVERVAVDVGGTFTDVLAYEKGEFFALKVPTTKPPELGVLKAVSSLGFEAESFYHATTIATNAILTGKHGKVCLITTKGFRDVLEIGRQNRPELYNLFFKRPKPLVERELRFGVTERTESNGFVSTPLDTEEVKRIARELCARIDGFVVSFINSHLNPSNELLAKKVIQSVCNSAQVTLSCEVDREEKEYERTSTAVVCAVLKPVVVQYFKSLSSLKRMFVMQSNGGYTTTEKAAEYPHMIVESGPAAGAVAVSHFSVLLGVKKALGFDMGGTTAKASTVVDGKLSVTDEYEVGGKTSMGRLIKGSGYPVRFPFVDLVEVSSGGGTIIWKDKGGALRVGPESAEAHPGPACYSKGGSRPTITDANLILGRLPQEIAAGIKLDKELAKAALSSLEGDPVENALKAIELANNQMAKAIRIVTVERAQDPADFVIFAFGGAGPLHVAEIMEELGIKKAIVPNYPGLFSALGLLLSDFRTDFVQAYLGGDVEQQFEALEKSALSELERFSQIVFERKVDMRYKGQSYTLSIPYSKNVLQSFHDVFEERYGYSLRQNEVEIVNLRLSAIGVTSKPVFKKHEKVKEQPKALAKRSVVFKTEEVTASLYKRETLKAGQVVYGPCVIHAMDSTILVPPNFFVEVDEYLNLVLSVA
ncbi:hypothetical protein B9Q00_07780 [Candidatus Marsarchaeota G1 archaeon OSP_C]|jgi:N-methylhydantoinase A/acetone carboxylase, beta subunit|uniref:5-oxoprolinase n=1 Tax=Candidatus Marsarchaeota G1 archaeon OSP_C TaxID=1978154 RepID=A0A2R6AN28_9ARCH|nr:MAG: hypothetical protein B9Q00_07780 [Candidatus Marsarchaeota G1 archaeon OSP_C]